MTADLERDLQLAVAAQKPRTQVVSVIEGGQPPNAPSGDAKGRRDAVSVKRQAPRPTESPVVQETAALPQLDAAAAPAVQVTETVEPAPAPIPEPSIEAPSGDIGTMPASGPSAGSGSGEGSSRRGGGWGTAIGAIIRGASAGVDNCGEHDRPRRRGGNGYPMGGMGGMGTMGGGGLSGPAIGGMIGGVIANGGIRRAVPRR